MPARVAQAGTAHGARRLLEMTGNAMNVLAIELLAAGQALDFHLPLRSSAPLEAARAVLRAQVPPLEDDRHFAPDIEVAAGIIAGGALSKAVAAVALPKVTA